MGGRALDAAADLARPIAPPQGQPRHRFALAGRGDAAGLPVAPPAGDAGLRAAGVRRAAGYGVGAARIRVRAVGIGRRGVPARRRRQAGRRLLAGDAAVPLPLALTGAPGVGAAAVPPPPWPATVPAPPIGWPGAPAVDGAPLFDPRAACDVVLAGPAHREPMALPPGRRHRLARRPPRCRRPRRRLPQRSLPGWRPRSGERPEGCRSRARRRRSRRPRRPAAPRRSPPRHAPPGRARGRPRRRSAAQPLMVPVPPRQWLPRIPWSWVCSTAGANLKVRGVAESGRMSNPPRAQLSTNIASSR